LEERRRKKGEKSEFLGRWISIYKWKELMCIFENNKGNIL
jgi:hypothetical protein